MKTKPYFLIAIAIVLGITFQLSAKAKTTIATNGKSTFTIIIPSKAPSSVQDAATELQKDIQIATGAKLPLQKDDGAIGGAFISLGSTQQAKAAGLSSDRMANESYRILTKDGSIYIIGSDTPDGERTRDNGTSNGTANGVYTFLEDYLDVRWLMPGDIGRDIPAKSTFTLEDINRTETPKFKMRRMPYIYDYATAKQYKSIDNWMKHQRLFASVDLRFAHNWWKTVNVGLGGKWGAAPDQKVVKKLYDKHPDWFAMDKNGKRPLPSGKAAKFETTNPGMVKWFAEEAIRRMRESGQEHPTWSLSPSDGNMWSESPESKALYDYSSDSSYDPEIEKQNVSMSSLVMKWYQDVAEIVAKEYPKARLTGYIYASFVAPPQKVSAKLAENFIAQIAPGRTAGYMLYRDDVQQSFQKVMDDWSKIITGDWYYYGLPIDLIDNGKHSMGKREDGFHGSTGNITPASPEILNTIFHQLVKSHVKGTTIYGIPAWSSAAMSNYILAKMQWDPTLDANDVQREWLMRAYGVKAGAAMEKFYARLGNAFKEYYLHHRAGYRMTPEMFKGIYSVVYPDLEKSFLEARSQPMTDVQKQRFQLIENNMIVLQWRLRNAHYLPGDYNSPLQRNDGQINAIIAKENASFQLFPGVTSSVISNRRKPAPLPWKVRFSDDTTPVNKANLPQWQDNQFLIYAANDGDIRIDTKRVKHGAYFAGYEIANGKGERIKWGIFNTQNPIILPAKAGETYMLTIPLRKPTSFELQINNATLADGNLHEKTLSLSGKKSPVYVFYEHGKEPVGINQEDDVVSIKMPYSGYAAQRFAKNRFKKEVRLVDSLDTGWLFSSDLKDNGVARGVFKSDFDDSSWTPMSPLNWWQKQNPRFADYHGVAWYRIKFDAPELHKGEVARLYFGAVDGNAEIYLNGRKVGEHILGPDYKGWDRAFTFYVHPALKVGENTLAVKVTSKNDTTASGIWKGVALIIGTR